MGTWEMVGRRARRIVSSAVALAVVAGTPVLGQEAKGPEARTEEASFKIGPEDVLLINVWGNGELTKQVPVRPDGFISLPLINDIEAAGLTPMQLRERIHNRLQEFVPTAEVSVIVAEVHSFKVSVIGKVNSPGRLELKSPTSVLDALAQAGGLDEYANGDNIAVLRVQFTYSGSRRARSARRIPVNYKRVTGGEAENLPLQPDDVVVVP